MSEIINFYVVGPDWLVGWQGSMNMMVHTGLINSECISTWLGTKWLRRRGAS